MRYSNPLPPEGINSSPEHPLKEMFLLTGALIALVVIFVATVGLLADRFAQYIPFKTELSIAGSLSGSIPDGNSEVEAWLQKLGNELAEAQNLPADLSITVHYVNSDTVNAMASLGGNIIMFRGLLEKLGSENAIAMVLAHEIAHIHHRDPIKSLGRGAIVSLALTAIGVSAGDAGNVLGNTGLLTELSFSRSQEQEADDEALLSLYRHYGHADGATDLFDMFLKEEPDSFPSITFFSTHPLTEARIDRIREEARKRGWPLTGMLTPVPQPIRDRIKADATREKKKQDSADLSDTIGTDKILYSKSHLGHRPVPYFAT